MTATEHEMPTLGRLARRTVATVLGAIQNRAELFAVEFAEENDRLLKMVVLGICAMFFSLMAVLLITGTIIFLVPEGDRVYAAGGFAVFYLVGAIVAGVMVKKLISQVPFTESLKQIKKDSELLDTFK